MMDICLSMGQEGLEAAPRTDTKTHTDTDTQTHRHTHNTTLAKERGVRDTFTPEWSVVIMAFRAPALFFGTASFGLAKHRPQSPFSIETVSRTSFDQ